ncbi:MAG: AAA family ATPase [Egibacteraceae bacterium]
MSHDQQRPAPRPAPRRTTSAWLQETRTRVAAGVFTALVVMSLAVFAIADADSGPVTLSLSELDERIIVGEAVTLTLQDRVHTATVELTDGTLAESSYPEGFSAALVESALAADVEVTVERGSAMPPGALVARLGVFGVLGLGLFLLLRARLRSTGMLGSRPRQVTSPATRFADVGGAEEITDELREVVAYLRDPDQFSHLGARAPKGVLLVGPPGTGKTLLARAVAGEADVPFFSLSGSDFIEKFVGVGASRVRGAFTEARKSARAIVFIDELDAIGKSRGGGLTSNDERDNTLNQLLVEMDGFAESQIVVLAATNRPDTLDTALIRPGRFDRQVSVGPPDRAGREAILRLHFGDRPLGAIDLAEAARRTPGFTGADLANLVNQAALAAGRDAATRIDQRHVDAAIATVMLGPERRSLEVLQRDREITAWHEAGHAVAAFLEPHAMDPAGVSIVPRGHAGGVTWMTGDDHQFLLAPQARAQLVVAMAGRAAEELVYGAAYTQGASGDLRSATGLATRMAAEFGMSELVGPVFIHEDDRRLGETADVLRRAVRELLVAALEGARELLIGNRVLLDAVAEELLQHETLNAAALRGIVDRVDRVDGRRPLAG